LLERRGKMLTTTKRRLRNPGPEILGACEARYDYLCTWAPEGDDDEIPLLDILENNGVEDAIWALRACEGSDTIARWLARWCALGVRNSWEMPEVVELYLRSGEESIRAAALSAARAAAMGAAQDAATDAAMDAAWSAAWCAAWSAARDSVMEKQSTCLRRLLTSGVPDGDITDEMVAEYGEPKC
jgi:hypothetical protein